MSRERAAARRSVLGVVVGVAVAATTLAACSGSGQSSPAAYDTVQRGDVATGVTSTGAFAAVQSEQLGFPQGGKLTEVRVKVGQHVEAGDILARIDDRVARHTLEAAEANLDAANAGLGRTTDSPSVSSAQSGLDQAKRILAATKKQRTAVRKADAATISRAKKQLSTDKDARSDAEDAAASIRKACSSSGAANAAQLTALANEASQQVKAGDTAGATQTLSQLSGLIGASSNGGASPCAQVLTVQAAVTAADQRVTADETALVLDQRKLDVDGASSDLGVETTAQAVTSAQSAYNAAAADRPDSIAQQQALVAAAQAQAESAQKYVDDTVLRAPVAGTIAALNGAVGEYLSASTGTTALAPGSKAAIPGASVAGAASTGAASPTRPGGSQFIVLSKIYQLQLVLPFEESDAAGLRTGQQVQVQPDALSGVTLSGTVVAVAPSATPISGVINFYATVRLNQQDGRLRDGQTARVTVLTAQHTGVLTVANTALRSQGGSAAVVVTDATGHEQIVNVKTGLVGPERTEITAGLSEGQRVVVSAHP